MTYAVLRRRRTVALALLLIAISACAGENREAPPAQAAAPLVPDSVTALTDSVLKIADASRIRGDTSAKVWIIEMSDFQCPYCRTFFENAYPRIKKEYVDRGLVKIAYVNFFPARHTHSQTTAERALCAGLQGKFWEYHDALFSSQEKWTNLPAGTPYFDSLAVKLKLDMSDMDLCVSSGMMKTLVAADDMRSNQTGADGSPAFVVGGTMFKGAQPFEIFKREIDKALAESRGGSGGK